MPNNKDRIAKLNKIIFGTEVQEDLEEAKKKKKKKKKSPKVTYTTGFPFLNDHRFNHAFGTCDCGKDAADDVNDAIGGGEATGEGSGDGSLGGEGGGLGESLTEAMSYTTIRKLLDEIWANRSGVEGVIAKLDTSGNVGPDIAKWAETKVANLVHIDGSAEFDLDQEMPDEDGDAYEAGEVKDTLNSKLKEVKTIVLISNFIKASASTKKQLLKLFARKNIQMIIITGTEIELRRIPQEIKTKFKHEISFIEKDNKEPAQAATVDNPVYDHAGAEAVNANESLTEAKREVRRYYIRPQNIFCANKAEIIKALIDIGDQNCSVYTLKYLGPEKDINKLTTKDIIYYYDNEILYDKNHVKVMDYDLYIKHEEERKKFSDVEDVPDEKFNDEYEDRIHQNTVLEDIDIFDQDFVDVDALGEAKEPKFVCCICGEPSEGYGNNPSPYKEKGRCCDPCNLKFVIPARYDEWQAEYSWPTLEEPDEVE